MDNVRAGFLLSLLPRKRMTELIRPPAEQLIELASHDSNSYISLIAKLMSTVPVDSCINLQALDSVPEVSDFTNRFISNYNSSGVFPEEILYLSAKSQLDISSVGFQSQSKIVYKSDFTLPTETERLQSYGIGDSMDYSLSTTRSITPPLSNPTIPPRRAPTSLFIPASKPSSFAAIKSARPGKYKKEKLTNFLDFDELQALTNVQKKAEQDLKNEKELKAQSAKANREAQKEAKEKEREEKRLAAEAKREKEKDRKRRVSESDVSAKRVKITPDQSRTNSLVSPPVVTDVPVENELQSPSNRPDVRTETQIQEITEAAPCLTPEERELILKYLKGHIVQSDTMQEFKLSERIFMDNDVKKIESHYIKLFYATRAWKKVKKTKRYKE
ncbi:hypothetical protein BC833DRAFT_573410 [Globomyces pollinis-pini]|nr:hypothetical protein BC833DRAFT_573410 [Globomyces pollinis-pini]